jgi:hypothetical protein
MKLIFGYVSERGNIKAFKYAKSNEGNNTLAVGRDLPYIKSTVL